MHSPPPPGARRRHATIALAVAALVYLGSLYVLQRLPGASLADPLFLFGVIGVAFPVLAWGLTRKPRHLPRAQGHARLPGVLLYLAVFSLLILGWGFSALNEAVPDDPAQSIAKLALKLLTMVVLPAWLFLRLRERGPTPFGARRLWLIFVVMALAYLAMQAVFGRGLMSLSQLAPTATTLAWAIPLCFVWQTVEAGLCEELLFRRVLQEHFALATGSQIAAIAWASLLFGLAHAPGLYLRGASLLEGVAEPTPGWAIAYSIVMIAPAGIAFGVLWARTRSLWLIVPLHGMVDLIPQLAPFIREWTGTA